MSRFALAHISAVAADVLDARGVPVATIALIDHEESLWVNADAIGRLLIADLEALAALMARRARDVSEES